MSQWQWKFQVRGSFVRAEGGDFVSPCEAIIESGVRDDNSPFSFAGVGPIARADATGVFHSWFVTKGTDARVQCPSTVSVFVRVGRGQWKPYVVAVAPAQCTEIAATELLLDLGNVQIEQQETPYVAPQQDTRRSHMGLFVIVAYKPKPGMDNALLAAVRKHVTVLRSERLVSDLAPYAMRAADGTIVEVFEWRSADAIHQAHSNPAVQALWGEFGAACDYVPLASLAEAQQMFAEFEAVDLSSGGARPPGQADR